MNYEVFDNSYCINVKTGKHVSLVQDHDEWYSPNKNEDGAIFEIVSDPYYEEVNIIDEEYKTCKFINVKSSLTGNIYRVLYSENKIYMKAKVISTGEIIDVKSLYPTVYSRLDCNGQTIEMYDEAELEFISNPNKPKMVSIDKVCDYLKSLTYQEYPGGPIERMISDEYIEEFKKRI